MSKLIVANWKSHKTLSHIQEWMTEYENSDVAAQLGATKVVIAPPAPSLLFVSTQLHKPEFKGTYLGVQDLSPFPAGAYTGAISTQNVAELNVAFAILGHSERRRYFHETHQEVANKVDQALQAGITPIVCVDAEYIMQQASAIKPEHLAQCWVAYEDLAAIGTGNNEPLDEVKKVIAKIHDSFGAVKVMYGGSVSVTNIKQYLSEMDGVIVGTHSLEAKDFIGLVQAGS